MKLSLVVLSVLTFSYVSAQDNTIKNLQFEWATLGKKLAADTSVKRWKFGGNYRLTLGQGSLSNWAGGGDEFSLSVNSALILFAKHKHNKFTWDNAMELGLGYIKTSSLGSRKNDDKIDVISKHNYSLAPKLTLTTLFNFRTQFLHGYSYTDTTKTVSSGFLSPGYVLLSEGLDYTPSKRFSMFVSPLTSRWVIVTNDSLAAKGAYGVDTGASSINQLGAFATLNYNADFTKNFNYRMRLDLFSNYRKNPWNVDIYMTNMLTVKVYKLFSFNWSVDMVYDDDTRIFGKEKKSPALQLKSIVGAGLNVPI
ncbi:MAG: hypothetical protein JWQ27_1725 [Ferruginibacter sp.]|nr:hypothetical protein [Ferruginibacter sp.]